MPNTIILIGPYRKLQSLMLASAQTPKPGQLLELTSGGELQVNGGTGLEVERLVALEDALQGKTIADAYAGGTLCDCAIMAPGSEAQVLLVAGQDIAINDKLMCNGGGKLTARTTTLVAVCVALEALDISASGAADALIKVRWL